MEQIWNTLKNELHTYCKDNGFNKVILGLSGGLDSAIVAVLAADVLGGRNVDAFMLKSRYTSELSLNIAAKVAQLNQINYQQIDIEPLIQQENKFLHNLINAEIKGIVYENLQARIRGQLLMAYSNQFGGLLLACGNKSEALCGYCTLYGDVCGGILPIGNLYKSTIFKLAEWRNSQSLVLPTEVITRAPSAELAEGQIDENSLPPYAVLDEILALLTDEHKSVAEVENLGFAPETVKRVYRLWQRSEFKRHQMPPALKIA